MSNTHGEISWEDDIGSDRKSKEVNKDLWLRLKEGSNVVRLLTRPFQYSTHKGVKKDGEKGFGRKLSCSITHGSCPLCDAGLKAGSRWYLGVLDRETGNYKILDVSYQVFSQIRKLARKTEVWGDPTKYDIDIVVDKNGGPTGYYSVQPIPHKPLTPQEQTIRDKVNVEELKERVQPLKPELVQKILDKIIAGGKLHIPPQKDEKKVFKNGAETASSSSNEEMSDDSTLDEIFPDHDATA